jgi:hypothetical protein
MDRASERNAYKILVRKHENEIIRNNLEVQSLLDNI